MQGESAAYRLSDGPLYAAGAEHPLVVTVAVEMAETLTVVPVAVEIAAASVLGLQLPEHPLVYAAVSETPESVIVKVIVVARLPVIDEPIEMPVLYEAHGEVHAPAAMP